MSLGQNIYKLRIGRKMSQEEFASAMEVSRQSVSKWENDMAVPELEKLVKMAKLFEVSLDELVGNDPPQPKPEPEPVSMPAPAPGITTGDLISVVLLFFAVITPILLLATAQLHNNMWLLFGSVFVLPPVVTVAAMKCSPTNRILYKVYFVFNIIMALIILLCCAGAPGLGLLLSMLYLIPIWMWYGKWNE